MTIGRHDCKLATGTDLKLIIAIGLDEVLTALEESCYDLTDEQVRAFPVEGENNIAWIVMHTLDNLDEYAVGRATGQRAYPAEWRWNLWPGGPEDHPQPTDQFPTTRELLTRLAAIRQAATAALANADEAWLRRSVDWHPQKQVVADFYVRTIWHANSHVRQIWLLRGLLGTADPHSWPQQHWT